MKSELTKEELEILNEYKKRQRKRIFTGVLIALILLIILFVYMLYANESSKGQVKEFDKAVQDKDYKKLTEMVQKEGKRISEDDAKQFVEYVNTDAHKSRYESEIGKINDKLESDNYTENLGKITDKNGEPIISVSKNGSFLFFIKKVSFEPHFKKAFLKASDGKAIYEFMNHGKNAKVVANKNQITELGNFLVGQYEIPTTKKFDDSIVEGSSDGKIYIDTEAKASDGKIYAKQEFEQTSFKVELENASILEDEIDLYINGEKVPYKKGKVYGEFPSTSSIPVYAVGRKNDTIFESEEVSVESSDNQKEQVVTLAFDKKEIAEHQKEEKKIEKKAKKFLERYIDSLNRSYEHNSFNGLRRYFEDDESDVATNIKEQVESKKKKTKFSEPKFHSYERKNGKVFIVLSKTNEKHKKITSKYELIYDEEKEKFKIDVYADI
ncbi:TPA_asm: hypothetical protein GZX72_14550 [Listeria monocytogenes]|nr:hypothetical protein [Listeria monocytogenes]